MRVIRSAGQNVSPSDDGRLFDQIFTDGLFEETTITHLGANNVALGAMYGIICGRDFTAEAQTVAVELPEDDAGTTGYIYVEIDTSSDDVITIGSALAPFTPTYEDLNTNGAVAQMIIAEYVASSVAITSLTPSYAMATSGSVLPGSVATVEVSPAVANHSVGDFILYGGQLYSVTAAISVGESLTPGTNISATNAGAELSALKNGLSGYMDWSSYTCTSGSWNSNTGNTSTGVTPAGVTATNWYNLTLDVAGTYLLCYTATFDDQSNTSGIRGMRYIVNESSIGEIFVAPPAQYTTISGFKRVQSNGSTNVRMGLYQNTGSSMAVSSISINAIYFGSR